MRARAGAVMVAKYIVVITAAPLRGTGPDAAARIILVKEIAGKNPAAADRHARSWFESAHPDFTIAALDVHTQAEYDSAVAELESISAA
jgi:hypothetical protein